MTPAAEPPTGPRRVLSDGPFLLLLAVVGGFYVVLIAALLAADVAFLFRDMPQKTGAAERFLRPLASPEIRHAVWLSLVTCTLAAILSLWAGVPLGYLLSRQQFRGKWLVDALLDIPIVLPPLVIGLSLLLLFQTPLGRAVETVVPVTYRVPSVVLAQFAVACAFAARTMRVTFDGIGPRQEEVALTLGASRAQAFWRVTLPAARHGLVTAWALAWARAMGEFGPILVFSGATRMQTEVLPTTVFLELSVGNLEAAVAVSLLMVLAAVVVLVIVRVYGRESIPPLLK